MHSLRAACMYRCRENDSTESFTRACTTTSRTCAFLRFTWGAQHSGKTITSFCKTAPFFTRWQTRQFSTTTTINNLATNGIDVPRILFVLLFVHGHNNSVYQFSDWLWTKITWAAATTLQEIKYFILSNWLRNDALSF